MFLNNLSLKAPAGTVLTVSENKASKATMNNTGIIPEDVLLAFFLKFFFFVAFFLIFLLTLIALK